jgi:GNAT superfamily N-acetyltransferase
VSEQGDRLAEMARNRGLKLLRSRVRTEGKPGFGCYGLADASGEPVFGVRGKRALRASAQEIEDYLRGGESGDWKQSVRAVGGRPKPKRAKAPPLPKPPPPPAIRTATKADAAQLARLFALLDHRIEPAQIEANLQLMKKAGDQLLVAARGKDILAACAVQATVHPHRDAPVGRITILVVTEAERGKGLGRTLVAEAERLLAQRGCKLIEVTSNVALTPAHRFYEQLGYARTSLRFAKTLGTG